jgi:stage V sporulation protein R
LIREFRLFAIADHESETELGVDCIHDDAGYRRVRKLLSHQHSIEERVPDVQIHRYARDADRSLTLRYRRLRGRPLSGAAAEVLKHVRRLWGFPVRLESVDVDNRVLETLECAA